jgi:hypothetical protein
VRSEEGEAEVVPLAPALDAVAVAGAVGRVEGVGEGVVLAVVLPPPPPAPPPPPPPADTRAERVKVVLPEVLPLEVEVPPTPPPPPPQEVSVGVVEGQGVEEVLSDSLGVELPVEVVEAVPPVAVAVPAAVPVCPPLPCAEDVEKPRVVGLEVRVAVRVALASKLVVGRDWEEGEGLEVGVMEGVALTVLLPLTVPLPLAPGKEGGGVREEEVEPLVEGVKLAPLEPWEEGVGGVEGVEVGVALALPPPFPRAPPTAVALPLGLGPVGVELELGWEERVEVPEVLGLGVEEREALVEALPTGHPPPPTLAVVVGGAMDPGTVPVGASGVEVGKAEGVGGWEKGGLPVAQAEEEGEEELHRLGLPLTEGLLLLFLVKVPGARWKVAVWLWAVRVEVGVWEREVDSTAVRVTTGGTLGVKVGVPPVGVREGVSRGVAEKVGGGVVEGEREGEGEKVDPPPPPLPTPPPPLPLGVTVGVGVWEGEEDWEALPLTLLDTDTEKERTVGNGVEEVV